jgi:hypothetical protein
MGRTYSMNWGGEKKAAYKVLMAKPERERPLGRLRHRWVDIKMDPREVWTGLIRLRIETSGGLL